MAGCVACAADPARCGRCGKRWVGEEDMRQATLYAEKHGHKPPAEPDVVYGVRWSTEALCLNGYTSDALQLAFRYTMSVKGNSAAGVQYGVILAAVLRKAGRLSASLRVYSTVLGVAPRFLKADALSRLDVGLADTLERLGRQAEAQAVIERSLLRDNEVATTAVLLGRLGALKVGSEGARELLDGALSIAEPSTELAKHLRRLRSSCV